MTPGKFNPTIGLFTKCQKNPTIVSTFPLFLFIKAQSCKQKYATRIGLSMSVSQVKTFVALLVSYTREKMYEIETFNVLHIVCDSKQLLNKNAIMN